VKLTQKRTIKNFSRPYIIAELGSNHNGDMKLARQLITEAKDAGADCVKFQSWSKDSIFSRKKYEDNYFIADDYRDRSDYTLEEIVDAYSISEEELLEMKALADEIGVDCTSTPFSKKEADFLIDQLDSPFIKVASMDLNNLPFLKYLAGKGRPMVLSTGLSELHEIDQAVRTIESEGNHDIVILHCVSTYPPKDEDVHLNNIKTLMECYPDYCIGFSTAVTRSVDAISALRTPAGSHERVGIVELFGRKSGETALMAGYLADAPRVLIAEVPFDMEQLAQMLVSDRADNPSNYTMAVISEGARIAGSDAVEYGDVDASGRRRLGGISDTVSEEFKRLTGIGTISQKLTYLMRTGAPDALDTMVARSMGAMAVQHLEQGQAGVMIAVRNGAYESVPVSTCIEGERHVDVDAYYDADAYRPNIHGLNGRPMFLG